MLNNPQNVDTINICSHIIDLNQITRNLLNLFCPYPAGIYINDIFAAINAIPKGNNLS